MAYHKQIIKFVPVGIYIGSVDVTLPDVTIRNLHTKLTDQPNDDEVLRGFGTTPHHIWFR